MTQIFHGALPLTPRVPSPVRPMLRLSTVESHAVSASLGRGGFNRGGVMSASAAVSSHDAWAAHWNDWIVTGIEVFVSSLLFLITKNNA